MVKTIWTKIVDTPYIKVWKSQNKILSVGMNLLCEWEVRYNSKVIIHKKYKTEAIKYARKCLEKY